MTDRKPAKPLHPFAIFAYAMGIALKEAADEDLLTKESVLRISKRADDIKNALFDGRIVELDGKGHGHIRDVEPEEEADFDEANFPMVHKAKTSMDV